MVKNGQECRACKVQPLLSQGSLTLVLCFDASLPRAICRFIPLFVQRDICCLPLARVGVHSESDAFPPSGSSVCNQRASRGLQA